MGDVTFLHGFQWIAVITLLFGEDEYDTPNLRVGPFRSLPFLKSWRRKFLKSLFQLCRRMPNVKRYRVSFEDTFVCKPALDKPGTPPQDPQFFSKEFLNIALRDHLICNPRNQPKGGWKNF